MTASPRITWMDSPSSFGAQVELGLPWQFVAIPGSEDVHFGILGSDGRWSPLSPVTAPERFGALGTRKQFRAWVAAFVAAGQGSQDS
jgi:hypothetical protein